MILLISIIGISMAVTFALRIPVGFSLGITSLMGLLAAGKIPLTVIPQRLVIGMDSFSLMAIPFFILAGNLMNFGGITNRIIDFCNSLLGRFHGGLGLTNIGASMVFGGVSGSMIADTTALGTVLIPAMVKQGYHPDFAAALTASASLCGPIIPPSIPMVVFGVITGVSILSLFLGGIIPGILIGLFLGVHVYFVAVKRGYPKMHPANLREIFISLKRAFWALMMPVVMLTGLLSGVFTPTEAAVVAAVYALLVGVLVYREMTLPNLIRSFITSAKTTGQVLMIVAFAQLFAWVLIAYNIPQMFTEFLLALTKSPILILLILNVLMLVMGCFMDPISNMVILLPLVMTTIKTVGIDPVHFGVVMTYNLCMGLLTPPFGMSLFIASSIAQISFQRIVVATAPFLITLLLLLLLIIFIPSTITSIPYWWAK